MTIKEIVDQRKIKYLLHFTRLENLDSILANGLLPRGVCAARGVEPVTNDAYRLDFTDAICLSVSFPNYKLFFAQREELKKTQPDARWVVIAVAPSVMWEKACVFCRENAANANVTAIPLAARRGKAAFEAMFSDYNDKTRDLLRIPDTCTTHPQAEVLVSEPIEAKYIMGAAFATLALKTEYDAKKTGHQFIRASQLFSARLDYAHWKKV